MSGSHLSKDFFELMCATATNARATTASRPLTPPCRCRLHRSKNIGECKSKQEEDKILTNEVTVLKQRFTETLTPKKMKEAIVRMMYAEMLGHDAAFGHIHAVNLSQQTSLVSKRVGYLASAVCLNSGHELVTLLVNTMRRDLQSSNHMEVCRQPPAQRPGPSPQPRAERSGGRCARRSSPSPSSSTRRRCPRCSTRW